MMRENGRKPGLFYCILLFVVLLAMTGCGQEEAEPVYGYQPTYLTVPEQAFKGVKDFALAEEGIYMVPENGGTVKLYDFRTDETDKLESMENP